MIAYIAGEIVAQDGGTIVVVVHDLGYEIVVPSRINPMLGKTITLFLHHHHRENGEELYGFTDYDELKLFRKLISVNGVGPKAGMAIISAYSREKIISAILQDDVATFVAVPGIGKKAAAKIILDLKNKIGGGTEIGVLGDTNEADDLFDTLEALGYKRTEIGSIVPKIPVDVVSVQDKVKWCLKNMAK